MGGPRLFSQKNSKIPLNFSLQIIFFSEQPFYGNYSTLDSHTNIVILTRLPTRQDGVEDRDKVYCQLSKTCIFFEWSLITCKIMI